MNKKSEFRLKYLSDNCTVKEETKYITKDSLIEKTIEVKGDSIPCPANEKGEVIYVKCPDKTVKCVDTVRTITITKTVELTDKVRYLESKLYTSEREAKKYFNYFLWVSIAFAICIFLRLKGII